MPLKLSLRIEIRGHERTQTSAIRAAVYRFLQDEELRDKFSALRRVLDDDFEMLYTETVRPIITSGTASTWASRFRDGLQETVESANRGPCRVDVRTG